MSSRIRRTRRPHDRARVYRRPLYRVAVPLLIAFQILIVYLHRGAPSWWLSFGRSILGWRSFTLAATGTACISWAQSVCQPEQRARCPDLKGA
jgi:hypothetical protein